MKISKDLLERAKEAGIEVDINARWEQGISHHEKANEIAKAVFELDWLINDDYFCWKYGGDGDNGEALLYLLSVYFEMKDAVREKLVLRTVPSPREDGPVSELIRRGATVQYVVEWRTEIEVFWDREPNRDVFEAHQWKEALLRHNELCHSTHAAECNVKQVITRTLGTKET